MGFYSIYENSRCFLHLMTFYESITVNPFHVTGLFLYPLKISEKFWFSDVFKGVERDQ